MAQSKQASTTAATVPPRCIKFFVHGGHSLAASSRIFGVIGVFFGSQGFGNISEDIRKTLTD